MDIKEKYLLLEKIGEDLISQLESSMNYLNIPAYEKIEGTILPVNQINSLHLWQGAKSGSFGIEGIPCMEQKFHGIRVGLYSIEVMDKVFKLEDTYWRHEFFAGCLTHDTGKDLVIGINNCFPINGNSEFTQREKEIVREHVSPENCRGYVMGENVAYMRQNHHGFQLNPYPEKSLIEETPERKVLTQELAILDCYDALTTRINNRTEEMTGKKEEFLSYEKARELLEKEYSKMKLEYHGDKLPEINVTGKEFIGRLYEEKIFRRTNPWSINVLKKIAPEKAKSKELEFRLNPFK